MTDYKAVVDYLYHKPYIFDSSIKYEDNTVENARNLRREFYGGNTDADEEVVNLLEVMVDLCRRYYRFTGEYTPAYYFRDMMYNLGVYTYVVNSENDFVPLELKAAIDIVNNRFYDQTGAGSLFPLSDDIIKKFIKDGTYDATITDLWKQMNVYWMIRSFESV
jgi:hypothetical protein